MRSEDEDLNGMHESINREVSAVNGENPFDGRVCVDNGEHYGVSRATINWRVAQA